MMSNWIPVSVRHCEKCPVQQIITTINTAMAKCFRKQAAVGCAIAYVIDACVSEKLFLTIRSLKRDRDTWKHTHIYRKKDTWVLFFYSSHQRRTIQHSIYDKRPRIQQISQPSSIFNIRSKPDIFDRDTFSTGSIWRLNAEHIDNSGLTSPVLRCSW